MRPDCLGHRTVELVKKAIVLDTSRVKMAYSELDRLPRAAKRSSPGIVPHSWFPSSKRRMTIHISLDRSAQTHSAVASGLPVEHRGGNLGFRHKICDLNCDLLNADRRNSDECRCIASSNYVSSMCMSAETRPVRDAEQLAGNSGQEDVVE